MAALGLIYGEGNTYHASLAVGIYPSQVTPLGNAVSPDHKTRNHALAPPSRPTLNLEGLPNFI